MRPRLLLLALLLPAPLGCGGSGVAPVSGRVTLNDKPLANVHVSFQPIAPPGKVVAGGGSYAITDADGRFTLRLVDGERPGAVDGSHRVEFTARDAPDDDTDRRGKAPASKVTIPPRYGRTSELTFEVPRGGTRDANFPLTSK